MKVWCLRTGLAVMTVIILAGCSSFRAVLTPEGQHLARGLAWESQGRFVGAAAEAALALEKASDYPEARELLKRSWARVAPGFGLDQEPSMDDSVAWDDRLETLDWLQTLERLQDSVGLSEPRVILEAHAVEQVRRKAAIAHWAVAKDLIDKKPGPRQARVALVEGIKALAIDSTVSGLQEWIDSAREASIQRLLVLPFVSDESVLGPEWGRPLANEVSSELQSAFRPRDATTVFPSDRLVTIPGAPQGNQSLSESDARALASSAGQNLLLWGQITRSRYTGPQVTTREFDRTRRGLQVTPEHPEGIQLLWKAHVKIEDWTTSALVQASVSVTEVPTGDVLVSGAPISQAADHVRVVTYTGDDQALTSEDQDDLRGRQVLIPEEELRHQVLSHLAQQIVELLKPALR